MIANQTLKETHAHLTNSHLLVQDFDYDEPASLAEAVALLERPGTRAVAGGTHLLVMMKMEREAPAALVNISKIPGLVGITTNAQGELVIGACTTIRTLYTHPLLRAHYPALVQAAGAFGSTQIQVMGTLGGNICNGSPASDTVPALFIYEARLVLESRQGRRELPIDQFMLGPGRTALRPGELLTAVILPSPPPGAPISMLPSSPPFWKIWRPIVALAAAAAIYV
jgi:aerobic carbon-monoxide dehydrogenase medium subunit